MSEGGTPIQERFVIRKRLGSGGMGVVYSAHDRQRDETVALKTFHRRDAAALYAFKKEFRTLADVAHPNLVSLYELVANDDQWFFTMELIDGETFIDHVRPHQEIDSAPTETLALDATPPHTVPPAAAGIARRDADGRRGFNRDRLRAALKQLAVGVRAIHAAGKVHRDLKPHNVLVTRRGRVVILDFGVARELTPALSQQTVDAGLPGTLAYMAPEQASGEDAQPASDWYAVGVMLFEALTGQLPFTGAISKVLGDKLHHTAPSPANLVDGLPADLVELCEDLMTRDAENRPSAAGILGRLGAVETGFPDQGFLRTGAREGAELIGRRSCLDTLDRAFRETLDGQAVAIHVHGTSGMGKTAIVHAFLRRLIEESRAVVLPGRCYVRELVPYKALDGVIDSLSRYLLKLPRREVEALLSAETRALTLMFPVLSRVEGITEASPTASSADLLTLRRRAFGALRELLSGIAEQQPVVLYIDDLQWADADSTALLGELLRPPDPPPLLLVTCFRTEEIASQSFLADLVSLAGHDGSYELPVEPLSDTDSVALVEALLGSDPSLALLVRTIVREAGGSPFLIEQLVGYAMAGDAELTDTGFDTRITLADMLETRIRQLPAGTEPLLLTLAAAGRPIDAEAAFRAAGLEGDERPLIAALKAAYLVRSSGSAAAIELYHERIREALAGRVDSAHARTLHLRLAATLIDLGFDDPEALFSHYRSAGERQLAAEQAALAARKASAALAFDRAALFYLRTLDLGRLDDAERLELRRALAESLTNAGRPADAAAAFQELAADSGGRQALRFRVRAAHEYLAGGYFDQGFRELRVVLRDSGLRMAKTSWGAILSLLWQRLRLRLRGLGFRPRDLAQVSEEQLLRIETCWAVAAGLGTTDMIRGADFQTRHLRLALDAGEPLGVAQALGLEVSYLATAGTGKRKRTAKLLDRTFALIEKVDDPFTTGLGHLFAGLRSYNFGDWRQSVESCDRAVAIFTDSCTGALWETTYARRYALSSRMHRGELAEICRQLPDLLAEADERSNVLAACGLRARFGIAWLAADDPEGCRGQTDKALEAWTRQGFHYVHFNGLISRLLADLYAGDVGDAWQRVLDEWPRVQRSLVPRVQIARLEGLFLRGRCALAAAAAGIDPPKLLRAAAGDASRIAREKPPYCRPMADLIRAGGAHLEDDGRRAARLLRQAADGFVTADMHLYAAAARRRLGELAGDAGRAEIEKADADMLEQQIRRPDRMAAMLAPGFDR